MSGVILRAYVISRLDFLYQPAEVIVLSPKDLGKTWDDFVGFVGFTFCFSLFQELGFKFGVSCIQARETI